MGDITIEGSCSAELDGVSATGAKVQLGEAGPVGRIDSTFGKAKFKCVFPDHGLGLEGLQEACKGAKLYLRYKRFVFDSKKKMVQD